MYEMPERSGMRIFRAAVLAAAAALSLCRAPAWADFEETGFGARAAGMANSFVGLADDVYAIAYNPGALGRLRAAEFTASYRKLYWGLTDKSELNENFLAVAYPLDKDGSRGTLGLAVWNYTAGDLYRENTVFVSYGRTLKDIVGRTSFAGLTVKALTKEYASTLYTENAIDFLGDSYGRDPVFAGGYGKTTIAVDVATLVPLSARATAGVVVKNINAPDTGLAEKVILPLDVRAGVCFTRDSLNIVADAQFRDGDITAGPAFERTLFNGLAAVRGGLALGSRGRAAATMGASSRFAGLRIDYSFELPLRGIQKTMGTHGMSIVVLFGESAPARPVTAAAEPGAQAYQDARRALERKEYVRAYDMFCRLTDSLPPGGSVSRAAAEQAGRISADMQRVALDGAGSEKRYAQGFVAYVEKRYPVCLMHWQQYLAAHGNNSEIRAYAARVSALFPDARPRAVGGYLLDKPTALPAMTGPEE